MAAPGLFFFWGGGGGGGGAEGGAQQFRGSAKKLIKLRESNERLHFN